ncbi:hypothetical protein Goklo_014598, partial [Gossypium klotzschianum]|nr:hypothetical protein [Gossypium klotzschianum]
NGLKRVVIEKKSDNLNQLEWEELDEKALSTILLCLMNSILVEVLIEKMTFALWKRSNYAIIVLFTPSYNSFRETLIYAKDKLSFEDVASRNQDKRCRYCKKLGHVKANCYKLRNKRATESNEEELTDTNLADYNGDDWLLVFMTKMSKFTSKWILDSGCSFHLCPNMDWLSTYSSVVTLLTRLHH